MPEVPSPDWLSWAFWAQDHESIRDLVITIAALVGIPFVIVREWLHHRQTKAALQQAVTAQLRHDAQVQADRDRRITDSLTRAVEQLGSDKLEARLGAIYVLERVARESKDDHWPIMETLTAYVRERAPWPPIRTAEKRWGAELVPQSPTDVQAVLTVISRRRREHEGEDQCLDLRKTDLRGYDLQGMHLERALFFSAHLEGANLVNAHLEGAVFLDARLQGAQLVGSHLQGTVLGGAHLEGAWLVASDITQEQFDSAITDEYTEVPHHIRRPSKPTGEAAEAQHASGGNPQPG